MNGPDHYREAQRAARSDYIDANTEALVHALLAVASAIVDTAPNEVEYLEPWKQAEADR